MVDSRMPVDAMTPSKALELLRRCLEEGSVQQSWHFKQELAKETITIADAEFVLRSGAIYDRPEQEVTTGEWKYKVEGPCAGSGLRSSFVSRRSVGSY